MDPSVLSVQQELERVLARSMMGEDGTVASLHGICSVLQSRGVVCEVVRHAVDEKLEGRAALFARIVRRTAPNRAFLTASDEAWTQLMTSTAAVPNAAWIACEPVVADDGSRNATVVAIGENDLQRDELLILLPKIARACAAILAREDQAVFVSKLTHVMNNLLTSVIVNIGYASHLLSEAEAVGADEQAVVSVSGAERDDLVQAMNNARDSSKVLASHVAQIAALGQPRGRH
jgi:hypothetical protein